MEEKKESEKVSKATAFYQSRPMLGEYCGDCWKFIPPEQGSMGRCINVAGSIYEKGWCQFFEPLQEEPSAEEDE